MDPVSETVRIAEKLDVCVRLLDRLVHLEERRVAADEALAAAFAEARRMDGGQAFADWRIDGGRYIVLDGGVWRAATAAESAAIQATHAAGGR